jgi:uncharacterized protein YjbJ (UPF0337 family)
LIPKSKIESYDGAQVKLKVANQDLPSFEEKRESKGKGESMLNNISEKIEDAKEKVEDKTKEIAGKSKHTIESKIHSSSSNSSSNSSNQDREYEEGIAGTNTERKSDPLTQYSDKEPMTPAKISEHEPTAVKRDPSDQQIASGDQTGTDTLEAQEEYRKRGMTKVDSHDHHSHDGSSCSCGSGGH